MAKFKKAYEETQSAPEAGQSSPEPHIFTWGGVDHDVSRFPSDYIRRLIERAIAHIQGNEVSAKISVWKAKNPEVTDEDIEARTLELRRDNLDRMYAGTMSVRKPQEASASSLESIALELAKADAFDKLYTKRVAAGLPGYWPQATRAKKGEGAGSGISGEDATVMFAGKACTRDDIARMMFDKRPEVYMEVPPRSNARSVSTPRKPKKPSLVAKESDADLADLL